LNTTVTYSHHTSRILLLYFLYFQFILSYISSDDSLVSLDSYGNIHTIHFLLEVSAVIWKLVV